MQLTAFSALAALVASVFAASEPRSVSVEHRQLSPESETAAASAVTRDLGFEQSDLQTRAVVITGDNTGYTDFSLVGRECWEVSFETPFAIVPHDYKEPPPTERRRFVAYVDSEKGHVAKVVSIVPEGLTPPIPFPNEDDAREQLRRAGPECWLGIPDSPPEVSLMEALQPFGTPIGGLNHATEIEVHYLWWQFRDEEPKAVWSIDVRGIRYVPRENVSDHALNHIRHIIDATTGEWIMSSNKPSPIVKEDK